MFGFVPVFCAAIEAYKDTYSWLQPTNIDELYRKLERRNTDMYVERALYLGRKKKRTSLLTLKVASIECMVFSDASMSGRNRLVEFMQQVNRREFRNVGLEDSEQNGLS